MTQGICKIYFYEIIKSCDAESVIHIFLDMCTNSPDIKVTEERIRSALSNKFAALILWEMTWFGYSEDVIQEKVKSWDE